MESLEPRDTHNQQLEQNVRPPGWTNPAPADRYNLVVIGAGTAGLVSAAGAAGLGARVALVEAALMGGDCLNTGCVPSKALLEAARIPALLARSRELGVNVQGVEVDFGAVMERLRRLRATISAHDSARRFRDLGVDVFLGRGRFLDREAVEVGTDVLRFRRAIVATGTRATRPPIAGLEETGYRTNETIFSMVERPRRLAVIGGGPIGCELGQAFQRLGSQVTLFQDGDRLLPKEDAEVGELILRRLREEGMQVHLSTKVMQARRGESGKVLMHGTHEVEVDEILIAAGRTPNVEDLGLEHAGVRWDDRKGVQVDDNLRTTNADIFAAGDVCSPYRFTHAADAMARLALRNAFFPFGQRVSDLLIPWCTYTDPEVAHVGLTAQDAAERGLEVECDIRHLREIDRAILAGETDGMVRLLRRRGTDQLVGATIVAPHAGEMITSLTLAIGRGLGLGALAGTIHPYPTLMESLRTLGDQYRRRLLRPWVKQLLESWFAWQRQ